MAEPTDPPAEGERSFDAATGDGPTFADVDRTQTFEQFKRDRPAGER